MSTSGRGVSHAKQQQQGPATLAWRWVMAAKASPKPARYGTLARKLPSMLQVSGLGQTLAFLYSKGYGNGRPEEKAEALLFKHLGERLREVSKRSQNDFMEVLLSLSPEEYRAATRQLAEVAEWLKRFAEGNLPKAKDE